MSYESLYQPFEDEKRLAQAQDEYENQELPVDRDRRMRNEGEFDGGIGLKPRHPESDWYWAGYSPAYRRYCRIQQERAA